MVKPGTVQRARATLSLSDLSVVRSLSGSPDTDSSSAMKPRMPPPSQPARDPDRRRPGPLRRPPSPPGPRCTSRSTQPGCGRLRYVPRRLLQIVLAGALLLCARPAAAEVSIWLKKGVSGFGSWFGFTGVDDGSFSLALGGGYSYEGVLELDLAVSRGFPDSDQLGGASLAIWIIESSIEVHPLKQSA